MPALASQLVGEQIVHPKDIERMKKLPVFMPRLVLILDTDGKFTGECEIIHLDDPFNIVWKQHRWFKSYQAFRWYVTVTAGHIAEQHAMRAA